MANRVDGNDYTQMAANDIAIEEQAAGAAEIRIGTIGKIRTRGDGAELVIATEAEVVTALATALDADRDVASQAEVEAGTNNQKVITPLRMAQGNGVIYRAVVRQSGTNAPTIENEIVNRIGGNITLSYFGVGEYGMVFDGASFGADRTFLTLTAPSIGITASASVGDDTQLILETWSGGTTTPINGGLYSLLEIVQF